MMFLIEISDDDYDVSANRKGKSVDDDIADREIKVLKMLLLIEHSKMLKMLLIERTKC